MYFENNMMFLLASPLTECQLATIGPRASHNQMPWGGKEYPPSDLLNPWANHQISGHLNVWLTHRLSFFSGRCETLLLRSTPVSLWGDNCKISIYNIRTPHSPTAWGLEEKSMLIITIIVSVLLGQEIASVAQHLHLFMRKRFTELVKKCFVIPTHVFAGEGWETCERRRKQWQCSLSPCNGRE